MDTLATIKDLDSYGIEYADEKLADKLLESVSAAVRDAAGCPITRGEYTVTIPGETLQRYGIRPPSLHPQQAVLLKAVALS